MKKVILPIMVAFAMVAVMALTVASLQAGRVVNVDLLDPTNMKNISYVISKSENLAYEIMMDESRTKKDRDDAWKHYHLLGRVDDEIQYRLANKDVEKANEYLQMTYDASMFFIYKNDNLQVHKA